MEKLSRYLSYLLRHNPEDLPMREDGFVPLNKLMEKIKKRFPWSSLEIIKNLANREDSRFEIKNGMIRALYGHTIPVKIELQPANKVKFLYHGTTPDAIEKILREGLKPMNRRKVHLSPTVEQAIRVAKRRTRNPVVLRIDVGAAAQKGIKFEKANELVYLSDKIPPDFISIEGKYEIRDGKIFRKK